MLLNPFYSCHSIVIRCEQGSFRIEAVFDIHYNDLAQTTNKLELTIVSALYCTMHVNDMIMFMTSGTIDYNYSQ